MTQASRAPKPWNKLRQHPHTLTHGLALLLLACQRGNEREAPCHPCGWVEVCRAPGYVLLSPSPCQIRPGRLPAPKVCLISYSLHEALIPSPQKDSRPTFLLFMIATSDHHLALRPSAPLLPTKPSLTVTIYLSTALFFIAEVSLLVFITPTLGWFLSMFRFGNSSLLPST